MRLHISNFGRIVGAELDIRPLTVLIGPNGTNKTWTTHALYAAIRTLAWNTSSKFPGDVILADAIVRRSEEQATNLLDKVRAGGSVVVEATVSRRVFDDQPESKLWLSRDALERAIGTSLSQAPDVSLQFGETDLKGRLPDKLRLEFRNGSLAWSRFEADGRASNVRHFVYLGSGTRDEATDRDQLADLIRQLVLPHPENALFLPPERTLVVQQYSNRSSVSTPVEDLYAFMSNAESRAKSPPLRDVESIHGLRQLLDEKILRSFTQFDPSRPGQGVEIVPMGKQPARLPVRAAASLNKSLAPLSMYLDLYATPGDFLFIDEPEMNAHPAAIVAMTELLACLASAQINVVVTTHSPHFVDHLTNLVAASALSASDVASIKGYLRLGDTRALLPPHDVAVYLFEDQGEHVGVRDVLNRDNREIDWTTFAQVSDETSNLYGEIVDREETGADM